MRGLIQPLAFGDKYGKRTVGLLEKGRGGGGPWEFDMSNRVGGGGGGGREEDSVEAALPGSKEVCNKKK